MSDGIKFGTPLDDRSCPHCGRALRQMVRSSPGIVLYTPQFERCSCPVAIAEYQQQAELEKKAQRDGEKRRHLDTVERLRRKSGIRPKYWGKGFDNFEVTPDNKSAVQMVRAYVKKFGQLEGKGLFISGTCGLGKTHLATAASLELIGQERSVICMTGVELLARIKQSYDDRYNLSEYEILREFLAAELLVIDDLGKENVTEWSLSMLYSMINMRMGELKPMIVTTNYTDEMLITRLSRAGDAMTALSIVSRLHEVCYSIEMKGPDYRSSQGGRK